MADTSGKTLRKPAAESTVRYPSVFLLFLHPARHRGDHIPAHQQALEIEIVEQVRGRATDDGRVRHDPAEHGNRTVNHRGDDAVIEALAFEEIGERVQSTRIDML